MKIRSSQHPLPPCLCGSPIWCSSVAVMIICERCVGITAVRLKPVDSGLEVVIAGAPARGRLRETAAEGTEDYDLILIDRAPSLDQLTINGLTAAVIVVTTPKLWSAIGPAQLLDTIGSVRSTATPICGWPASSSTNTKAASSPVALARRTDRGRRTTIPPSPDTTHPQTSRHLRRHRSRPRPRPDGHHRLCRLATLYADHLAALEKDSEGVQA